MANGSQSGKNPQTTGVETQKNNQNDPWGKCGAAMKADDLISTDDAVRAILRKQIVITRAILYQDYVAGRVSRPSEMQLHVDEYLRAERNYKLFNEIKNATPTYISRKWDNAVKRLATRTMRTPLPGDGVQDSQRAKQEILEYLSLDVHSHDLFEFDEWHGFNELDRECLEESHRKAEFKAFISRFKMAIFGGFALLAPMLIMTLHATKLTALLTTAIFVLVVAGILAASMRAAENKDVITATVAYTAVLVVFVGTANPGGNLSDGVIGGIVVGAIAGLLLLIVVFFSPAIIALRWWYWRRKVRNSEESGTT